ncbi:hypothetical protein PIB30_039835 [Stylosanthes scabra]|uniref:Uncharacterized protein n=1 Tax=Stylosanthes scabra TaxID=79078 RepID=A0ABU6SEL8_9FABA|nr:hypothetical protein [Stylosanthes scabra]
MQTLFKDRKFYKKAHSVPRNIANDFDIHEPYVAQQGRESNDCVVWVAHWMKMANLWSDYNPEIVNFSHRYRLATSLLLSKANVKRDEVGLAALRYYEGRDVSREKELDMSSDSSSSGKANVSVDVDSDSVEI